MLGPIRRELDDVKVELSVVRLHFPDDGVVVDPVMVGRRRSSGGRDVQNARRARRIAEGDVGAEMFEHLAGCRSADGAGEAANETAVEADGHVR